MNKGWDNSGIVFDPNTWKALKEHLHPGAFCFAFSSTRTLHRMMVAIEDAGFVIHPFMALWNFSNGFPKASNPAYQFDAMEGKKSKTNYVSNEGCADNTRKYNKGLGGGRVGGTSFEAATENRSLWQGHRYGLQALKPAFEPIVCFQKPYPKKVKPVVSMLETGAGALNVDRGRIGYEKSTNPATNPATNPLYRKQNNYKTECGPDGKGSSFNMKKNGSTITADVQGRWPSNLLLCHLPECKCVGVKQIKPKGGLSAKYAGKDYVNKEGKFLKRFKGATRASKDENGEETTASWECVDGCPVLELSSQSGYRKANARKQTPRTKNAIFNISSKGNAKAHDFQDSGTASRYYFQGSWDLNVQESIYSSVPVKYVTKPAQKEKNAGLDKRNTHPTVKPIRIAEYLAKLLLPPKGYKRRLLVPFSGSGSEMIGARKAGWDRVIGIELLPEHIALAKRRLKYWEEHDLHAKKPEGIGKQSVIPDKHKVKAKDRKQH